MRGEMGRVAIYVVTTLCAVLSADAALAQDALLVAGRFYSASRNFGQDLGPARRVAQQDIFAGQRFAVVRGYDYTDAVNLRTGATVRVSGVMLAVDQARPRVFVRRTTGVWMADVESGAEAPMWSGDGTLVRHCALAYSPNVLLCGVRRTDGLTDVVAIDVATSRATTVAAIRLPPREFFGDDISWLVTSDGRRLYFAHDAGPYDTRLAVLNTTTGTVTTSMAAGYVSPYFELRALVDDANERVLATGARGVQLVLSKDLAVLGTASISAYCVNAVVSPHTGRLYLGEWTERYPSAGGPMTLRVFDASTYAPLAPAVVPGLSRNNDCPFMAVLTAPGAPKDLNATVLGSAVILTWTNVGGASGFVLDVGFAPGRTDLQIRLGPDARLIMPHVPSGTYFLRLRGGNESGGGRPSSEIRVVVP